MAREPSLAVYRSVFRATEHLSRRARGAFLLALCEYYFDGVEPHDLPRDAMNVWRGVEYRILRARAKANATDGEPLPDAQPTPSDSLASGYAEPTDSVAGSVAEGEHMHLPAETSPAHADVDTDAHAEGWGSGCGGGLGRGHSNYNEGFSAENAHPISSMTLDEAIEAVEEYAINAEFGAMLSSDDAISRWVDKWHGRGWVDAHGDSMDAIVTSKDGRRVARWVTMLEGYARGFDVKAEGSEPPEQWHDGKCHKCGGHAQWRMGGDGMIFRCGSCGEYSLWL